MKTGKYTIGVDLGGTNTSVGLVDEDGKILSKRKFLTKETTPETWGNMVALIVKDFAKQLNKDEKLIGIGIGAPCANYATGCIEGATDLRWDCHVNLVNLIGERTDLPVYVCNDANAAALGEMIYGAAKGMKNFIVLTLGTGVGGGIVCDGKLLNGSRGFAGELGHVTFPFAYDRMCSCGRTGCLQTVASASGIVKTAQEELILGDEPSSLRKIPLDQLTSKIIYEEALNNDKVAKKTLNFVGKCLGKAAAEFAAFSDPEAVILFGGVANAGELLLKPMRTSFKKNALFLYRDSVKILLSSIPESDAAILGAASLPFVNTPIHEIQHFN